MTPDTGRAADPARKDWVASLASQIPNLTTGARAALRRLFLTRSAEATGVVTALLVGAGVPDGAWHGPAQFKRWELLAHVAAVLSGTAAIDPHKPGISFALGRRLSEMQYSELRLMRLTSARGPALTDQIVRVARVLASGGGVPVDLRTLHALTDHEETRADQARLDLARAYYAAEHAKQKRTAAP